MKEWNPTALLHHLTHEKNGTPRKRPICVSKVRVQPGGHDTGVVAVFFTEQGERFTYSMPAVDTAKVAVLMVMDRNPDLFQIKLSSESANRAVFKAAQP